MDPLPPPPHARRLIGRLRRLAGPVIQLWGWPGSGKRAVLTALAAAEGEAACWLAGAVPAAAGEEARWWLACDPEDDDLAAAIARLGPGQRLVVARNRRQRRLPGSLLGPEELRLTAPEVGGLAGAPRGEPELRRLHAAGDGWLEPLRLALAAGATDAGTRELAALPAVTAFLRHRVLEGLPEDLGELLLELSVGDDLEADGWREVWGDGDRRLALLGRLLTEEGLWLEEDGRRRLPRLLRAFLGAERDRLWPPSRTFLAGHHRALADYGRARPGAALAALLAAGDRTRLEALLELEWPASWRRRPAAELIAALERAAFRGASGERLALEVAALAAESPAAAGADTLTTADTPEAAAGTGPATVSVAAAAPRAAGEGEAPSFRVQLFGTPAVVSEDGPREVVWTLRRGLSIFAFLASSPGRAASRETILEAIYSDEDEAAVRRNFHPTLSHLRRDLAGGSRHGPPPLLFQRGVYRLNPAIAWWIDSEELERLAKAGHEHREAGEAVAAVRCWQSAWRLYRGPFLHGFYVPWATERRETLSRLYLELLRRLGDLHFEQGDLGAAIDAYRTVLATDPLQEPVHRSAMRIYARQGRRDLVRRQYVRLSELLRVELGVEPHPHTTAEYHRLMG